MNMNNKVVFPSALRAAAAYNSEEFSTEGKRGVRLFTNRSAAVGTLIVKLQVKDPISGTWADVTGAATASLSGTGLSVLTVHPNLVASANVNVQQPVGPSFRVVATVSTNSVTFSVAAVLCD